MSTRCNIVIKEGRRKSYIYHHCDGYPSGVGALVHSYLKDLYNWYQYHIMNDLIKDGIQYRDSEGVLQVDNEYRWTDGLHGDIDYVYVIDCKNRTLTCYKRPSYDTPVTSKFEKDFDVVLLTD